MIDLPKLLKKYLGDELKNQYVYPREVFSSGSMYDPDFVKTVGLYVLCCIAEELGEIARGIHALGGSPEGEKEC